MRVGRPLSHLVTRGLVVINSSISGSGIVKRRTWACILGVGYTIAVLSLSPARAQTEPKERSPKPPVATGESYVGPKPTFRADTNLVVIPVAVTDTVNRFVLGLQKVDFHLFEDGVEQNIAHFSGEDAPLSIGVLFDKSGSMTYKLGSSRDAATQLLNTLNQDDEAFLVEFADLAS